MIGNSVLATVSSGGSLSLGFETASSDAVVSVGAVTATMSSGGATVLSGGVIEQQDLKVLSGGLLALGSGGVADSLTILAGGLASGTGLLTGQSFDLGSLSGASLAGFLEDAGRGAGPADLVGRYPADCGRRIRCLGFQRS